MYGIFRDTVHSRVDGHWPAASSSTWLNFARHSAQLQAILRLNSGHDLSGIFKST